MSKYQMGHEAWNKGLTKYTDTRLASEDQHGAWKGGSEGFYSLIAYKIWEDYWREKRPIGYIIHHIDRNRENNEISNLALITVSNHAKIHIRKDGRKRPKMKIPQLTKPFLLEKYINEQLSTIKIARICKCGSEAVRQWLIKYGIPRRRCF